MVGFFPVIFLSLNGHLLVEDLALPSTKQSVLINPSHYSVSTASDNSGLGDVRVICQKTSEKVFLTTRELLSQHFPVCLGRWNGDALLQS